jgi:hypothetical protein
MRALQAILGAAGIVVALACAAIASRTAHSARPAGDGWRTDPVWHDGQAEVCVYDAKRTIYDKERAYVATAYTDQELYDRSTTCKSADERGVPVFKHHWSERVPTENYDYDFSTMTFTGVEDLASMKLTAATQEDCGASFKEIWRTGSSFEWWESVYFPAAGHHSGRITGQDVCFFDDLTLRLRDYDFVGHPDMQLHVVPMQKDTHSVSFTWAVRTVHWAGTSTLDVPYGAVRVHELDLLDVDGKVEARYWFAADAKPPILHALVRFEGPQGIAYALRSLERKAYWKRG